MSHPDGGRLRSRESEPKQVKHGNQSYSRPACRLPDEVVDFTAGQDCDEGQYPAAAPGQPQVAAHRPQDPRCAARLTPCRELSKRRHLLKPTQKEKQPELVGYGCQSGLPMG